MKAITFLGAAKAYETTYVMPDGREHTAPYFGAALARFFPGLQMRVFVTEEARRMHYDAFKLLAEDYVDDLVAVPIGNGSDETELWSIFAAVVDAVNEEEKVVFDITHGFRSLPFLSFLAAAYLRTVKHIDLVSVLYGSYEARDQQVTPNRAPVIDLSSFVSLLDWMTAADRFIRFGDASDLAQQLYKTKPDGRTATQQDFAAWKATGISSLSRTLSDVSQALTLIRPADAMVASERLKTELPTSLPSAGALAQPLAPLGRHIAATFAELGQEESQIEHDRAGTLAVERSLIDWYLQRKQLVQATAVAREWLISYVMLYCLGPQTDPLDKQSRRRIEHALGASLQKAQAKAADTIETPAGNEPVDLSAVPDLDQLLNLYNNLGEARNDLMHAGKRPGAKSADVLSKQIEGFCRKLVSLPIPAAGQVAP